MLKKIAEQVGPRKGVCYWRSRREFDSSKSTKDYITIYYFSSWRLALKEDVNCETPISEWYILARVAACLETERLRLCLLARATLQLNVFITISMFCIW